MHFYLVFSSIYSSFYYAELQVLGSDFVFGFIQAVDQERDPRNLLILFSLFPIVANYFRLEPFAEELFEVFGCYFPIDFTAPADDPYGITKEQLSDGLARCLTASTRFADYCLPLLQEKLDSDLASAKVEALRALELCCETYGPAQLDSWIDQLWSSIRREVLVNVNGDVLEHAALDALTALSRASTIDDQMSPSFSRVLQSVLKECLGHLCEPERRLMTPSSHVLLAICAGSPPACKLIMGQVIPLLLDQFNTRAQTTPRQFILHTLNKMIHAGLYGFTDRTADQSGVHPAHSAAVIDLYLSVLNQNDAALQPLAVQGLSQLVGIGLNRSDRIVETLLALLDRLAEVDPLVEEVSKFFRSSAENAPEWAVASLLPRLANMIEKPGAGGVHHVMSKLPPLPAIREQLVPKLMALLETAGRGDDSRTIGLLRIIDPFSRMEGGSTEMFQRLHRWALDTAAAANSRQQPPPSLPAACAILRNLASALSLTDAIQFVGANSGDYVDRYLTASAWTVAVMEATFGWLNICGSSQGTEGVTASLVRALQPLALGDTHQDVRLSAGRLIAALINKLPEGDPSPFDFCFCFSQISSRRIRPFR